MALKAVHIQAVCDVDSEDQGLRDGECFQEIHGPPHLGDYLGEDRRAAVGVHDIHDTIDALEEGVSCKGLLDDKSCVIAGRETIGGVRGGIVGRRVCDEAHAEENDEEIEPDCGAGEPAVPLQRADLVQNAADDDPDDDGDDEADFAVCDLIEGLRRGEGSGCHVDDPGANVS